MRFLPLLALAALTSSCATSTTSSGSSSENGQQIYAKVVAWPASEITWTTPQPFFPFTKDSLAKAEKDHYAALISHMLNQKGWPLATVNTVSRDPDQVGGPGPAIGIQFQFSTQTIDTLEADADLRFWIRDSLNLDFYPLDPGRLNQQGLVESHYNITVVSSAPTGRRPEDRQIREALIARAFEDFPHPPGFTRNYPMP